MARIIQSLGLLVIVGVFASHTVALELEEVVVTAQKRSQSAQDVPVAVTALSGEAMREAGVFNTKDLTDVNPSISFETGQSSMNSSLKIRGIGSVGNGRTFEGAVGVFVDGVYRSRSAMALVDMNDIGSLEVLRGPQGTLFGKNTVAGALSLQSTLPNFDGVNGHIEALVGSFDKRFVTAALNIPVGDAHALRVSMISNTEDGYLRSRQQDDRTFNQTDRHGVKAQWLYDVSDSLQSLLILDYSKSDAGCCWGSVQVGSGPLTDTVEYYANLRGLELYKAPEAEDKRLANNNLRSRETRTDMGVTLRLEWALEALDIRSVTGLRRFEEELIQGDADFGPAHLVITEESPTIDFWSQEFNFFTNIGIVDIVAGAYYSKEKYDSHSALLADTDTDAYINYLVTRGAVAMATGQDQETAALCRPSEAVAGCAFVHGTNSLAPPGGEPLSVEGYRQDATSAAVYVHTQTVFDSGWTLVAGLRYSRDEKEGGYDQIHWYDSAAARALVNSGALGTPPSGDAATPRNAFDLTGLWNSPSFQDAQKSSVVSGTASLQYTFTDEVMAYLSYSRGYKSGAVNLFKEGANFDNTAYEPEYATGQELGLKARYWDNRAQTNIAVFNTEYTDLQINFFTGLNFFTVNAGEAISRGVEIENVFQVTDRLRTELNVTVLDARFGDLSDAPETVRHLDGRETPRAPTLAAVAVANYEQPLSDRVLGYGRLSASYTGEHFVNADQEDEPKQEAYTLWDMALGMRFGRDLEWDVSLFCKNCTDETYRSIYFAAPLQTGSFNAYLNSPRTVGLSIRSVF